MSELDESELTRQPIGIFDSGVGGLSVLREIRALLPHESLIYCADSGYAPYGDKSQAQIRKRSLELGEFLIEQGAKAIVIACNTATAAAATAMRERWPDVPIIAMEPAVKPAAAATKAGVVGVLATVGTLASAQFAALLDNFGQGTRVVTRPGIGLVEAVEQGDVDSENLRGRLRRHLTPLLEEGADVIVLGCTHYVFLRESIQLLVGDDVRLIDTGRAVARQLAHKLEERQLLQVAGPRDTRYWTSGNAKVFQQTLARLLREVASPSVLPISRVFA
ncbi:glutamate racemase [Niveibacterium sp. SC-1]|uniref:glutamate racemase n=1 Tax=Niveibacterium sp. SC-1 TaxID=3135646 RepID=UPI00311D39C2